MGRIRGGDEIWVLCTSQTAAGRYEDAGIKFKTSDATVQRYLQIVGLAPQMQTVFAELVLKPRAAPRSSH